MSIIEFLEKDKNHYLKTCFKGLKLNVNIAFIDHARGETSSSFLFYLEKNTLNFEDAIAILTMRLMMYQEEWNDLESYNQEDVERWIGFLKRNYKNSEYNKEKFVFEYENEDRLTGKTYTKSIILDKKSINLQAFESINPLKNEKIIQSTCSNFLSLTDEYYVETEKHYVLFHWYTTA